MLGARCSANLCTATVPDSLKAQSTIALLPFALRLSRLCCTHSSAHRTMKAAATLHNALAERAESLLGTFFSLVFSLGTTFHHCTALHCAVSITNSAIVRVVEARALLVVARLARPPSLSLCPLFYDITILLCKSAKVSQNRNTQGGLGEKLGASCRWRPRRKSNFVMSSWRAAFALVQQLLYVSKHM